MDANQEVRAMILCVLPFPPLPVQAKRFEDGNRVGDALVITSHDILSHLLEEACVKRTPAENASRRIQQIAIMEDFIRDLENSTTFTPEQLYDLYCAYTRRHICTYTPLLPDLYFMPLAYCCKGDPTHRRVCDYMSGQSIFKELPQQAWKEMDFPSLLNAARERFLTPQTEDSIADVPPNPVPVNVPDEEGL